MKRNHFSVGWLIVSAFLTLQADVFSQSVLVGPGVRNGGFNMDAPVIPDDNREYNITPYWYNIGSGGQGSSATRTNLDRDGSRNHGGADVAGSIAAHDTGHIISAGEEFEISYWWRDASGWHGSDEINIRLYTTDNDEFDGVATTFTNFLSGVSTVPGTYEAVTNVATATSSEAGKRLFVAVDAQDGGGTGTGYFRFDDFTLTVSFTPDHRSTVIDYDPALANGGFMSPVGSTTTNWGTGINVSVCATNTGAIIEPHGSKGSALSIVTDFDRGGLQRTSHTVRYGERFSLIFDWRAGWRWTTSDAIHWRLLTTSDNTVNGTVSVITSGTVSGKSDGTNWSTAHVLSDGGRVTADHAGKLLWLEFYPSAQVEDRYALIDMVRLRVTPPGGMIIRFQ